MSVRITIIGTGYVGLTSGACLAALGHDVICVDRDPARIDALLSGRTPIYEPGLDELVARNISEGRLRFSLDTRESVKDRDVVFLTVGTPTRDISGHVDLSQVVGAAVDIAGAVDRFTAIVIKSTVPVGTNRMIAGIADRHLRKGARVAVVSNPEFLREGSAIADFMQPDRVVVGAEDNRALEIMRRIYAPLVANGVPFLTTGIETAELIKYAANAFLAVKVSFINEISNLCEVMGADVTDLARGIGLDKRIGAGFLQVGPGWGGSCFPKDTRALQALAADAAVSSLVVEAAIASNAARKQDMARRIIEACGGDVARKKLAVLGLTFKGQTDDMRDSASLDVIPMLQAAGACVHAFDPAAPRDAARLLPGVVMAESATEAVSGADALVVLSDWKVFRTYDLGALAVSMNRSIMVDLRNLFDRDMVLRQGFERYHGLGVAPGVRKRNRRATPRPEAANQAPAIRLTGNRRQETAFNP